MNKGVLIGLVIAIFLVGSMLFFNTQKKQETETVSQNTPVTAPVPLTTSTIKNGAKVSLPAEAPKPVAVGSKSISGKFVRYSSSIPLILNLNSDNQLITSRTENEKSSFIEVYKGAQGDCYKDYCKSGTVSTKEAHGITWEFLGNPEYCNGTECSQASEVYRTSTNGNVYYLAIFEYGPKLDKESVFSTFTIK